MGPGWPGGTPPAMLCIGQAEKRGGGDVAGRESGNPSLPPAAASVSLTAPGAASKRKKKKSFKFQLKFSLARLAEAALREGQMLFFSQLC